MKVRSARRALAIVVSCWAIASRVLAGNPANCCATDDTFLRDPKFGQHWRCVHLEFQFGTSASTAPAAASPSGLLGYELQQFAEPLLARLAVGNRSDRT